MSDALIAAQAKKIFELEAELGRCKKALEQIHLICVGIGGPLNDNRLGYTRGQLGPFWQIDELAK